MSKTYELAPQSVIDMVEDLKAQHHTRLLSADVKIGIIMVHPEIDEKSGFPKAPAISGHAGKSAAACVKTVPLKDRLTKGFDVEMLIDGYGWNELTLKEQVSILDHELTHIELKGEKDDLGRPVIKLREEDFAVWGFFEVIARHGIASMEFQGFQKIANHSDQLLLGLVKEDPEVTVPTFPPTVSVEITEETLSKLKSARKGKSGVSMVPDDQEASFHMAEPSQ